MKLGLSSYTFGWAVGVPGHSPEHPLDEHGLLDQCHAHGLRVLQIGDNLPLHSFDAERLGKFAERAARENVQLEVGARGLRPNRLADYARIARQLKAKLIRFVIDDVDYHPEPATVTAVLKECMALLDGLTLGLENHDRFPARIFRGMVESAGSDGVGVCLDTANSLGCGEGLATVLRELGPLAVNLHIKDFSIRRVSHLMGFTVEGRPAGQGFLDVPRILKELAEVKRCETAILEMWTPPEPILADTIAKEALWAQQSVGYLKPFFT